MQAGDARAGGDHFSWALGGWLIDAQASAGDYTPNPGIVQTSALRHGARYPLKIYIIKMKYIDK